MTTPPKQRSPSKDRYAASHPAITVHFDVETFNRLVALRQSTGLSLNQLIRAALDSLEPQAAAILERGRRAGVAQGMTIGQAAGKKAGFDEGWKAGVLKAKEIYRLTYPCAVCRKPIELKVGDSDAQRAIEVLVEDEWSHSDCVAT